MTTTRNALHFGIFHVNTYKRLTRHQIGNNHLTQNEISGKYSHSHLILQIIHIFLESVRYTYITYI